MWEPAISGMGNAHNCVPKLQAYPPIFSLTPKASGSTLLQSCEVYGIFVSDEMQSYGIGKLLLDYIKNKKVRLRLNVYQKNTRALSFYQREEFNIQCEGFDGATGEKEYPMLWQQKQKAILGRIPMDIANMVLFLCSEKAGFITGENICIDGGMTKQMIYHGDCGWRFDI